MTIVSNTSPIINLAAIDQLTLLRTLFDHIVIPQAVYDEIVITGAGEPGAREVLEFDWISSYQVKNRPLVDSLGIELDAGEAEAIACAIELKADRLLIDEQRGRTIAQRLGLSVTGIIGVLIEAKRRGEASHVKPELDALIAKAGFWIDRALYEQVLRHVGEQ
jgi:predicted nucleic acid-binding protein